MRRPAPMFVTAGGRLEADWAGQCCFRNPLRSAVSPCDQPLVGDFATNACEEMPFITEAGNLSATLVSRQEEAGKGSKLVQHRANTKITYQRWT